LRLVLAFTWVGVAGGGAAAVELAPGQALAAATPALAEAWAQHVDALVRSGGLRLVRTQRDGHLVGHRHLRYDQLQDGVRIFGAQLVQQIDETGRTVSVFGRRFERLDISTEPGLSPQQAAQLATQSLGPGSRPLGAVDLVILPLEDGPRLVYTLWVGRGLALRRCFVDASSGQIVLGYDDLHTAATVGVGTGVWGDLKKLSVESTTDDFRASDHLRPPALATYDLQFDGAALGRLVATGELDASFLARDGDNEWDDGAVVDAHTYAGWTYDYYFKRHGRRGIDDRDLGVASITHFYPVEPGFANAFWNPFVNGLFYGDGDSDYASFAAGLDVAAHEYTHGVTDHTWKGIYLDESGALNEAFSDIMGTAVEFFHEPPGDARRRADYWLGEDVSHEFDPASFAARSMENPSQMCSAQIGCHPDHYHARYLGRRDNGGVHVNSAIANQAFYLLVEGGTNRTSGMRVQGLGTANRERAEKIFYRGFTAYLTPRATFADARDATAQAARDLYGADSAEVREVSAAWTAVGVE